MPPDQAEICTENKSLKVAEEENVPHSNSISTSSTDLPSKSSESNLTQNSDEMNPDPRPTMRIMASSRLELEKDTTKKSSVESTRSVESDIKFYNKR